jgi:hypothetical protein
MKEKSKSELEAIAEGWLTLSEVLPHYAELWCGGREHATCSSNNCLTPRRCSSDKCWAAGLAMQGVVEAYETVAKIAAPLGMMTFTKCFENGKIPYAFWSEKYSLIHFDNKLSALHWFAALREQLQLEDALQQFSNAAAPSLNLRRRL